MTSILKLSHCRKFSPHGAGVAKSDTEPHKNMGREIQLDGAETSVVKAIGIGSSEVDGGTLIERCQDLDVAEVIDAVRGLMMQGFVEADSSAFYNAKEMADVNFRVNSGYAKDLKEALDEKPQQKKSKRVRRE